MVFSAVKNYLRRNDKVRYIYNCYRNRNNEQFFSEVVHPELAKEKFYLRSNGEEEIESVFYNVEIKGGGSGYFAIYRLILDGLYMADRLNMIPYISVVDSYYNDSSDDNVYDFFYEQTCKKEDIQNAKNIIDFEPVHSLWFEERFEGKHLLMYGYDIPQQQIEEYAILSKKYIKYKDDFDSYLRDKVKEVLGYKKTIGVHFRGNAFTVGLYGHPIALTIDDYYPYIDECLSNGFEQIFLACDDNEVLNNINNRYPGKVVYYEDTFRSSNGQDVHQQGIKRKNNGYEMAREVVLDMYTLSCCEALICGKSQVSIASRIEKLSRDEKYEYTQIIDKGLNETINRKSLKKYRNNKFYKGK